VERAYRQSTRLLGLALLLLGTVLVAVTLARGGGPLALGVLVGLTLAAVGGARAYLAGRPTGGRGRA
jgi:hypothetical protein